MSLDNTLAEPHATLGTILDDEHHWDEAEAEYRKAISLNPNYVWAHQWYSVHLAIVGRPNDGLRESLRAKQLDPLSSAMMWNLAGSYFCAGKIDEAISEYTKLLKLELGFARAYDFRGGLYSLKGLKKETLADWETYHNLTKDEYGATLNMAASEALWGSKERAVELAEDAVSLLEKAPTEFSQSVGLVWIYALLGDREKFFEWLDRAIERDEVSVVQLRYDPNVKVMREDPRYAKALKKLNLGESREIIGLWPQ
jgi:tetratricopeptide (TPR) repeat protein